MGVRGWGQEAETKGLEWHTVIANSGVFLTPNPHLPTPRPNHTYHARAASGL